MLTHAHTHTHTHVRTRGDTIRPRNTTWSPRVESKKCNPCIIVIIVRIYKADDDNKRSKKFAPK
jgi:hypothetical protein